MLIDKGRIDIEPRGPDRVLYIHSDENGLPMRVLERQRFQTDTLWQRAIDDWLANFHDKLPLKRVDGAVTTVGAHKGSRT